MECWYCEAQNPDGYVRCVECGQPREHDWCCLLCGAFNPGALKACERCGLPQRRDFSFTSDYKMPPGWEKAEIMTDEYENIDGEFCRARLMVRITNHAGVTYSQHTAGFIRRYFDESAPPEPMSPEAYQASQDLRTWLSAEGWKLGLASDGTEQPFSFWRRLAPQKS